MQGTPADLATSGVDFAELVAEDERFENDEKSESHLIRQMSRISSRSIQTSNSVSVSSTDISADGSLWENEQTNGVGMEASSKGKIKGSIAINYFRAGANWFSLFVLGFAFFITQLLACAADYWVAIW